MKNTAFGLIETIGLVSAIEALDAALKAANVMLVSKEKSTGGFITIIITGDVGSVTASVQAGKAAAEHIGTVVSAHVIPRMTEEIYPILFPHKGIESSEVEVEVEVEDDTETATEADTETEFVIKTDIPVQSKSEESFVEIDGYKLELIDSYKVVELRHIARALEISTIERNKIKYANKEQLLVAIQEHLKGGQ